MCAITVESYYKLASLYRALQWLSQEQISLWPQSIWIWITWKQVYGLELWCPSGPSLGTSPRLICDKCNCLGPHSQILSTQHSYLGRQRLMEKYQTAPLRQTRGSVYTLDKHWFFLLGGHTQQCWGWLSARQICHSLNWLSWPWSYFSKRTKKS